MTEATQWGQLSTAEAFASLASAIDDFERHFTIIDVYDGRPRPAFAPTGEVYVEHRHGPCGTADDVISLWIKDATSLRDASPRGSALYWRVRPEIAFGSTGSGKGWMIYSRFIISSKPRKD